MAAAEPAEPARAVEVRVNGSARAAGSDADGVGAKSVLSPQDAHRRLAGK